MISKIKIKKKLDCSSRGSCFSALFMVFFQLVRYAFSSFLKRPSVWISLILAGIAFQAFRA